VGGRHRETDRRGEIRLDRSVCGHVVDYRIAVLEAASSGDLAIAAGERYMSLGPTGRRRMTTGSFLLWN
jgi:hypothetical protein